ncbi:MAG: ribonuclease H family protein [Chitinophagaceae bacterium]|nr:ribonuclease H family protein [Chitinophagaceae bacterium]
MPSQKNKYYVVWNGIKPGIYSSWEECRKQVERFSKARYKGFPDKESAEKAFREKNEKSFNELKTNKLITQKKSNHASSPIPESIVVDAACNSKTGQMEYQGIYLKTGKKIFHQGPFEYATNNVGEFLAIVHALAYLKKIKSSIPVYSDSNVAILWVKNKKPKTQLVPTPSNKKIFELLNRAVKWLEQNNYENPILKWETKSWGENPADFGRK